MTQAISGESAKLNRSLPRKVHGSIQWRTNFIGARAEKLENTPQAYLVEMDSYGTIPPHFHQVDQFQVLVAGSGKLGRNATPLIALHYVDHHTAYGPINAGPCGLSLFTIRSQSDPGAIYLDKPDHKDFLKPTKKRYLTAENIGLSTRAVLQSRSVVALGNLFESADTSDGLGAFMLRLGAGMNTAGPDPKATGGLYYLVLNGDLELDGMRCAAGSLIYTASAEDPVRIHAGADGLETLILVFPKTDVMTGNKPAG